MVNQTKINEQRRTETELVKLRTGKVHKRKNKYLLLDERIQEIVKSYNPEKKEETLNRLRVDLPQNEINELIRKEAASNNILFGSVESAAYHVVIHPVKSEKQFRSS
ncbi:unnamed protein product [Brachionus calyciflorus]|uniref:Uncharacterized protein n=1 Tax=Brachionus calyciflorus TaxID=104777 RepID=A0A814N5F8_9BILA|nr:unnamed protein product [Brachionus calyciflorus]